MNQDWTNKIVIVTGGGGGMGQAAARRFAEIGASCGGCVTVDRISRTFTGPRAPTGVVVEGQKPQRAGDLPSGQILRIDKGVVEACAHPAHFGNTAFSRSTVCRHFGVVG